MQNKDFLSLGVCNDFVTKLALKEIITPTEVQVYSIPEVLAGQNIIVQAPTGSGKTLAYLLPLMSKLDRANNMLEGIILVPSRELAVQVNKVIKELIDQGFKTSLLIGGSGQERQLAALKEKPKIVVGTPGRTLEILKKRKINAQEIKWIVVDEVDKMFRAGFMDDVLSIFKATLRSRQALFYSATIPSGFVLDKKVNFTEPKRIIIGEDNRIPQTIKHLYIMSEMSKKNQLLEQLLFNFAPLRAMVFIQRNEGAGPLAGILQQKGFLSGALHGGLSQQHRKEVLKKFRQGKINVLVTTDLLARGMDIEGVELVFNYDLPQDDEFYLHRAGRTGRAQKLGTVISLIEEKQKFILGKYSRSLKISFAQIGIDDQGKVFFVRYKTRKR